jgi:hypothetical protein
MGVAAVARVRVVEPNVLYLHCLYGLSEPRHPIKMLMHRYPKDDGHEKRKWTKQGTEVANSESGCGLLGVCTRGLNL